VQERSLSAFEGGAILSKPASIVMAAVSSGGAAPRSVNPPRPTLAGGRKYNENLECAPEPTGSS
jgi:hypothetical protein